LDDACPTVINIFVHIEQQPVELDAFQIIFQLDKEADRKEDTTTVSSLSF